MTVTDTTKRYVLTEKQLQDAIHEGNKMADPQLYQKAAPAKPGYKTSELLVAVVTAVGAAAASLQGSLPDRYAAYAGMAASVAYIISRGLAKH